MAKKVTCYCGGARVAGTGPYQELCFRTKAAARRYARVIAADVYARPMVRKKRCAPHQTAHTDVQHFYPTRKRDRAWAHWLAARGRKRRSRPMQGGR